MIRHRIALAILGIGLTAGAASAALAPGQERGRRLAQANCGGCHALGDGPSPLGDAPPFARLYLRYPRDGGLADLLREGMIAPAVPPEEGEARRHPRMPQVRFDEDQIADLIAFLRAAQVRDDRRP